MSEIVLPCPVCGAELTQDGEYLICANAHWELLPPAVYVRRAGTPLLPGLEADDG